MIKHEVDLSKWRPLKHGEIIELDDRYWDYLGQEMGRTMGDDICYDDRADYQVYRPIMENEKKQKIETLNRDIGNLEKGILIINNDICNLNMDISRATNKASLRLNHRDTSGRELRKLQAELAALEKPEPVEGKYDIRNDKYKEYWLTRVADGSCLFAVVPFFTFEGEAIEDQLRVIVPPTREKFYEALFECNIDGAQASEICDLLNKLGMLKGES